ncbi:MAG: hypothetical protein KKC03_13165 [Bacteroidetes bacterium]|nr:hypothetical protein [Bacteroidota bacterium]
MTTLNVSGAAVIGDGADAVTVNASKTTVKGPFVIGRTDTTVALSVKRFEPFDLHDKNQLGKFVVGGDGKMKLVSMYDEYRQIEGSTSIVRRHPDYGVGLITNAGDSLVIVDGANQSKAYVFESDANNWLRAAPSTGLVIKDGKYFISGTGGAALTIIDFLGDRADLINSTSRYVFKGNLSNRNSVLGVWNTGNSNGIVNDAVNSVAAIRSPWPFHRDAFGRQLSLASAGTAGGLSRFSYNAAKTLSIYDSGITGSILAQRDLAGGGLVYAVSGAARDSLVWIMSPSRITGDAFAKDWSWSNQGVGSQKWKYGDALILSDVEELPGASGAGNNSPLFIAGNDSGLVFLHSKAGDNTNGAKQYKTDAFVSPILVGDVAIGFSPASTAQVVGTFSTGGTVCTFVETVNGPLSHAWRFDGTSQAVNIDNLIPAITSDTYGSIDLWIKPDDGQPSALQIFCSLGDTDALINLNLQISAPGQIGASARNAAAVQWSFLTSSAIFPNGATQWTHVALVHDGVSPALYVNGVPIVITFSVSVNKTFWYSSLPTLDNVRVGCLNQNSGGNSNYYDGDITPPVFTKNILVASIVSEIHKNGQEAIQSPTSDLLPTLAVKAIEADPSGQHVLVTSANEVTLMSQTGAVQDTFKCTGCGTLNHAVFGPKSVGDSLEIYIGGSLKYRRIGNEVSVEALAAREYQDRSVMFGSTLEADSAGYGNFWKIQDMLNAASVVNTKAGHVKAGTYNDPITSIPVKFQLWGDGPATLVTNASLLTAPALAFIADSVTVSDMDFSTAIAGAGGGQNAITFSGDHAIMQNINVRGADNNGIQLTDAANALLENTTVAWADNVAISITGEVSGKGAHVRGGSFLAGGHAIDNYTPNVSLLDASFSGGTSAAVFLGTADSCRVQGNEFKGQFSIRSGAVKNILTGNTFIWGYIIDNGTGTVNANNVQP